MGDGKSSKFEQAILKTGLGQSWDFSPGGAIGGPIPSVQTTRLDALPISGLAFAFSKIRPLQFCGNSNVGRFKASVASETACILYNIQNSGEQW